MKYLLLGAAAALAIGSASQAQVTFSKGVGSFSVSNSGVVFGPDTVVFDTEFDVAFNAGNFGFQVGSGSQLFTNFSSSFSIANFDLHAYKNTGNGNKFGAYISSGGGVFFGGGNVIGAEAMIGLGALDVEASVGYLSGLGSDLILASLDVYVDVSPSLEVSAGYEGLFDGPFEASNARVGAAYAFGSSGYAVTADYNFNVSGGGSDSYNVGVSWEFGPNTDERLFGDRYFDVFAFGSP